MCKGGSGSNTSTTTQVQSLDPTIKKNYEDLIAQAKTVAGQPYQQYNQPLVAGFTPEQTAAVSGINSAQGIAQPYYNTAAQFANQSTTPLTPTQFSGAAVQQYMDPYIQNVINATQANIGQSNQIQQRQLMDKAISSGASPFGGDRAGIAAAELARNQDLASNQTIAGLQSQGYGQAVQQFNTQQQTALAAQQANNQQGLAAAGLYGNLGNQAQQSALQGLSAQLQAGTLEQQQNQAQLTSNYNQFQQQQYFPYQQTGWLANIVEGLGNQFGGSSTSTQQQPGPSGLQQGVGLGLSALGILGSFYGNKRGGRVGLAAGGALDMERGSDGVYRLKAGGAGGGEHGGSGNSGGDKGSGGSGGAKGSSGSGGFSDARHDAGLDSPDHYGGGLGGGLGGGSFSTPGGPTITRKAPGSPPNQPRPGTMDSWGSTVGESPEDALAHSNYNKASWSQQHPSLGMRLHDTLVDLIPGMHQWTANAGVPDTYSGGEYHDAWSPLGAAGTIGGAFAGPGGGLLGGRLGQGLSNATGAPEYGFGGGGWESAPNRDFDIGGLGAGAGNGPHAAPGSGHDHEGSGAERGVPFDFGHGGGNGTPRPAVTGSGTPIPTSAPPMPAWVPQTGGFVTGVTNPDLSRFNGLSFLPGQYGIGIPQYSPAQFGMDSAGGVVSQPGMGLARGGLAGGGVFNPGMLDDATDDNYDMSGFPGYDNIAGADATASDDTDPSPDIDWSSGTGVINFPSEGHTIDTGLPAPVQTAQAAPQPGLAAASAPAAAPDETDSGSFADSPWMALAQAGLAMAASRNPSGLGAAGEGGLYGLQAYQQTRDRMLRHKLADRQLGLEESKLPLYQAQTQAALANSDVARQKASQAQQLDESFKNYVSSLPEGEQAAAAAMGRDNYGKLLAHNMEVKQPSAALQGYGLYQQQGGKLPFFDYMVGIAQASRAPTQGPEMWSPEIIDGKPTGLLVSTHGDKKPDPSTGPFRGTSMDAQNANILLDPNADTSSPVYRAAYSAMAQPKTSIQIDPATNQPFYTMVTPDMSAYRAPTEPQKTDSPASDVPAAEPKPTTEQQSGTPGVPKVDVIGKKNLGTYKGNEGQNKAMLFASYVDRGTKTMDELMAKGYRPTWGAIQAFKAQESGNDLGMANYYLSPDDQRFYQAAREINAGILRNETGAAFGKGEVLNTLARYIPMNGEDEKTWEQKRKSTEGVENALWANTGLPKDYWNLDKATDLMSSAGVMPQLPGVVPGSDKKTETAPAATQPSKYPIGTIIKNKKTGERQIKTKDGWAPYNG